MRRANGEIKHTELEIQSRTSGSKKMVPSESVTACRILRWMASGPSTLKRKSQGNQGRWSIALDRQEILDNSLLTIQIDSGTLGRV